MIGPKELRSKNLNRGVSPMTPTMRSVFNQNESKANSGANENDLASKNIEMMTFHSSQESSLTEKKDISLQVDKGIVEESDEASQMMYLDDSFLPNPTFIMKYFESMKMAA